MDRPRHPDLAARLFGGRAEHTLALLRAAWPAAVGPEIARRSQVVALDRGILRIKVADARWQKNLQRMRGDLLARLRAVAGGAAPRAIGFVLGETLDAGAPPSLPSRLSLPPPPAPPPPARVTEAAAAIPDPEIRALFVAVAGRYLTRFRGPQDGGGGSGSGAG